MGIDRLPDISIELWREDGHTLVRAVIDGVPTGDRVVAATVAAQVTAFAHRIQDEARPTAPRAAHGARWAQVERIVAKHGHVSSRLLAAVAGLSRPSAGWYLARMGRLGKLVRTGPREWRIVARPAEIDVSTNEGTGHE